MAYRALSEAWEGQQIVELPLDALVLWSENPRDPLPEARSNSDVILHALDPRHERQWQLKSFAKEMGDRYDQSELPTVSKLEGTSKYRVYDGNRRVALAILRRDGIPTQGDQFELPLYPDKIPCNVCEERVALENVLRKHANSGTWKPYERDLFMYRYMGGEESVLVRMEELVGAISKWPSLNQRYVKEDVLNDKHLVEMGLDPDLWDYGVDRRLLERLMETINDKLVAAELSSRRGRNDPLTILPEDVVAQVRDDAQHHVTPPRPRRSPDDDISPASPSPASCVREDDTVQEPLPLNAPEKDPSDGSEASGPRTRQTRPSLPPMFGSDTGLRLRPGDANNVYRTLESMWEAYSKDRLGEAVAFPAIFRMGLRMLVEQAASDEGLDLAEYVDKYAKEAKSRLRNGIHGNDVVTYLSSQSVDARKLKQALNSGAHAYTSTNNPEQARALSILIGAMITLSHGKR